MTLKFTVTHGHRLLDGVVGGLFRMKAGETLIGALSRQVAHVTRCDVVAVREASRVVRSDRSVALRYELTLRQKAGDAAHGAEAEGTIVVAV